MKPLIIWCVLTKKMCVLTKKICQRGQLVVSLPLVLDCKCGVNCDEITENDFSTNLRMFIDL